MFDYTYLYAKGLKTTKRKCRRDDKANKFG